jgi:hypothetical protein
MRQTANSTAVERPQQSILDNAKPSNAVVNEEVTSDSQQTVSYPPVELPFYSCQNYSG